MTYISSDSINTFSLHDGQIVDIWFSGTSMFWKIDAAIVCGSSCEKTPCNSLNTGEDRYAEPYLEIEFQNFEISCFLRNGYTCHRNNKLIDEFPAIFLFKNQYQEILNEMKNEKSIIYSANEISQKPTMISIVLSSGKQGYVYTLQFTISNIISRWQAFGDEAWYLDWYRKNSNKQ